LLRPACPKKKPPDQRASIPLGEALAGKKKKKERPVFERPLRKSERRRAPNRRALFGSRAPWEKKREGR